MNNRQIKSAVLFFFSVTFIRSETNGIHGKETPHNWQDPYPTVIKTKMTRSAQSDPEVRRLLGELENLGHTFDLPEAWGANRTKKILKTLISVVTPGICPVCGRRLE